MIMFAYILILSLILIMSLETDLESIVIVIAAVGDEAEKQTTAEGGEEMPFQRKGVESSA